MAVQMEQNHSPDVVFVQDKNGRPLMPTKRFRHVRQLIKDGRAVKISSRPYVVQLTYDTLGITQDIILGIDPGRTNIGLATVRETGETICEVHVKTRNKEVPELMKERKAHRQTRRRNRRKKTQRRAFRNRTVTKKSCKRQKKISDNLTVGILERKLPGCEKPVPCIGIKNREARFLHRLRPPGWLTPTARHLLETHVHVVKKLMNLLPVTKIVLEVNRFAFMVLDNPHIQKWQYQKGPLYGHGSVKAAVSDQQEGYCLFCNRPIDHYHHIVPRSMRGGDTVANVCGLCEDHHELVHQDEEWKEKLEKKKAGMTKKFGAASILNQIIPSLAEELAHLVPENCLLVTSGRDTALCREDHGIDKLHHADAYCIACSVLENQTVFETDHSRVFEIRQFRRHDRKACKQARLDRKYYLNGKLVAVNRHKSAAQTADSLEEYRNSGGRTDQLQVPKHPARYQRMDRIMPGAVFFVNGKYKVLQSSSGTHKSGNETVPNYYNFTDGTQATPRHCPLICMNTGLVWL